MLVCAGPAKPHAIGFFGAAVLAARSTLMKLLRSLKISKVLQSAIFFGVFVTAGCARSTVTDVDCEVFETVLTDLTEYDYFAYGQRKNMKVILHKFTNVSGGGFHDERVSPDLVAD